MEPLTPGGVTRLGSGPAPLARGEGAMDLPTLTSCLAERPAGRRWSCARAGAMACWTITKHRLRLFPCDIFRLVNHERVGRYEKVNSATN